MNKWKVPLLLALLVFAQNAFALSNMNKKELMVFGMKSMGMNISVDKVKNIPSEKKIFEVVATGINVNGYLCAQITKVSPLKVAGGYEVICIANRGGTSTKSYTVNSNNGKAHEL